MTKVLLPGSYDPITRGHIEIARRAAALFDEVHVVVFINPAKKTLFTPKERLSLLTVAFENDPKIKVDANEGLVADYAAAHGISFLLKGVRDETDFSYELPMADHHLVNCSIDTLLLPTDPRYRTVSSHAVRDALAKGDDLSPYLTDEVAAAVLAIYRTRR